jgi:hypothetical protein
MKRRTYYMHVELSTEAGDSVNNFELTLIPKKVTPQTSPGSYVLRLSNSEFTAGDLHRQERRIGGGNLSFDTIGIPTGVIFNGWLLSPLMSFYVPGKAVDTSKPIPVADSGVGDGWRLTGNVTFGRPTKGLQPLTLDGALKAAGRATLSYSSTALFDPATGWPNETSGKIENGNFSVSFTVRARR